jgi:hypothetical protein
VLKIDLEIMRKQRQENIGLLQILHPTLGLHKLLQTFMMQPQALDHILSEHLMQNYHMQ